MLDEKKYLFKGFNFNESIPKEELEKVEKELNVKFPSDYVEFMIKSNGGEGNIGESYLRLWKIEELVKGNEDYSVSEFAPGLLIIGSDGGGTAFGYDFREEIPDLVEVDFIGMDIENPNYRNKYFFEFIEYLYNY
ncbi:SMI1/KNR4 family protein [Bacillus sp. 165]|uniref:SMI1/KNR4 family protein n=1 Tax=Bacillus sp. 165 TaxID=1529117 RepID=UPI001ADC6EB4|nr:SMI1/KNR4 family protein [Bacillus sp. 165]